MEGELAPVAVDYGPPTRSFPRRPRFRMVVAGVLMAVFAGLLLGVARYWVAEPDRNLVCTVLQFPRNVRATHVWTAISVGPSDRAWIATCDETKDDKAIAWFCALDQQTLTIGPIAAASVFAVDSRLTLPQAKIHTRLLEGYDGRIYGWTQMGQDGQPGEYAGGHLFAFLPSSRTFEDFGVVGADEGIIALAISPDGRILYGVTYPSTRFFRFDIPERRLRTYAATSNGQPTRSLEVLADGTVLIGGRDLVSGKGKIWVYTPSQDRLAEADLKIQPLQPLDMPMSKADYACWLHKYWLASILDPATDAVYTTGYLSGHLCRITHNSPGALVVQDLGRTVDWYESYVEPGPFAHSIAKWRDWLFLFVDNDGVHHPNRVAGAHLVAFNTRTNSRVDLGRLVTVKGEPLAHVTASACSQERNRLYFASDEGTPERAVLCVLDLTSLPLPTGQTESRRSDQQ